MEYEFDCDWPRSARFYVRVQNGMAKTADAISTPRDMHRGPWNISLFRGEMTRPANVQPGRSRCRFKKNVIPSAMFFFPLLKHASAVMVLIWSIGLNLGPFLDSYFTFFFCAVFFGLVWVKGLVTQHVSFQPWLWKRTGQCVCVCDVSQLQLGPFTVLIFIACLDAGLGVDKGGISSAYFP